MSSKLDEKGRELLDNTPVELPLGFEHPESLEERIRRLVRTSVSDHAAESGAETFEEADDFDIADDDSDPLTPFEMEFDPALGKEVSPQMVLENKDHYDDLIKRAVPETMPEMKPEPDAPMAQAGDGEEQ